MNYYDINYNNITKIYINNNPILIVQQPKNSNTYVSLCYDIITQFMQPLIQYGNIVLLAHNTMCGQNFYSLKINDEVIVEYKNGDRVKYCVNQIKQYQALEPENLQSNFIDLETSNKLTVGELFDSIYGGENKLVLQTCLEKDGNSEWGRYFVIAFPQTNKI